MRNKIFILFLFLLLSVHADWSSSDSSHLSSINRYTTDFYNGAVGNSSYEMGWRDYSKNMYLFSRELSEGKSYRWGSSSDAGGYSSMYEVDPFSSKNETFFSRDVNAQDNTTYYQDNILSYFKSNYNISYNNSIPDSSFLNYPEYGSLFNRIHDKMYSEGLGISSIANSQQTEEIRQEVASAETKIKGMISNDYSNSTLSYDFSEIGNFFVRSGNGMTVNPFSSLTGTIRIKPEIGDYHYEIWHRYFDRTYSSWAIALSYCIHTVMFLWFTIYVINDLMSIVNA